MRRPSRSSAELQGASPGPDESGTASADVPVVGGDAANTWLTSVAMAGRTDLRAVGSIESTRKRPAGDHRADRLRPQRHRRRGVLPVRFLGRSRSLRGRPRANGSEQPDRRVRLLGRHGHLELEDQPGCAAWRHPVQRRPRQRRAMGIRAVDGEGLAHLRQPRNEERRCREALPPTGSTTRSSPPRDRLALTLTQRWRSHRTPRSRFPGHQPGERSTFPASRVGSARRVRPEPSRRATVGTSTHTSGTR